MGDLDKLDALELLREWFEWWEHSPQAPAKLPSALHVKTAILLNKENLLLASDV